MKKTWAFLGLLLISVAAYAALDWEIPNNVMKMGDGTNATTKSFEMKMGLGASNPVLSSLDGTEMKVNIPFRTESDSILGDGTAKDLSIKFDMNGTADIPEIKYDNTVGELVFKKKTGANFKKFGTGSGGGGGENFNNGFGDDDNPNAEDGTTAWTNSGGTFAVTAVDPLEGEQSFTYDASAQNDYVESSVLSFDRDVFRGNACEARVEYIGGDENLSLKVIDGNNDVLVEQVLPAHGLFGQESAFFICPTQAEITGDANKGNLRYRIENVGASAAPLIKFDRAYMGTLRGLTEQTLPDVFSVRVDASTAVIADSSGDMISSCSKPNTNRVECTINPGLTVVPSCTIGYTRDGIATNETWATSNVTTSLVSGYSANGSGNGFGGFLHIICKKQGADAKQSVQIYKTIPTVSTNVDEFSAAVNVSGGITHQNSDAFVNCTNPSTGNISCNFKAGLFTTPPACVVTPSGSRGYTQIESFNTTSISTLTYNSSGNLSGIGINIVCQKQGADFRATKTQNIALGGIVVNSAAEASQVQVRTESCRFQSSGAIETGSELCETWVDSTTKTGTGQYTIDMTVGVFSKQPNCACSAFSGSDVTCQFFATSPTQIRFRLRDENALVVDSPFSIVCQGKK